MTNVPSLTVVVRNKEKILFNGQAQTLSSVNDKGPFDILVQHENFITLIKKNIVIHITPKEKKEIQIENGLARIYDNKVFVYVNFKS